MERRILTPADRLIIAADFDPTSLGAQDFKGTKSDWVREKVIELVRILQGTGVCIKVNSALRVWGYELIEIIHDHGLKVFADLKLNDIGATLAIDGILLQEYKPDFVTVMCTTGISAMQVLKAELPDTEVLGVTVLTSLKDADTKALFTCSIEQAVMRFGQVASDAKIDGLISSPAEVEILRAKFGMLMSLNTPAIRPEWSIVKGDDQNLDRVMTPVKAIRAGADRLVIGRPITQTRNPRDAVMRTLDEIANAL